MDDKEKEMTALAIDNTTFYDKLFLRTNYYLLGLAPSAILLPLALRLLPSLIRDLIILLYVIIIAVAVSGSAVASRFASKFFAVHMVVSVLTAVINCTIPVLVFIRSPDLVSHMISFARENDVVVLKLACVLCGLVCFMWVMLVYVYFSGILCGCKQKGHNYK